MFYRRHIAPQRKKLLMAFNFEEWNKLSEADCERRYRQRLHIEEQVKNIAAFLAFILICALLIYVFTGLGRSAPDDGPVAPRDARLISLL
jgi:hypothetical protein